MPTRPLRSVPETAARALGLVRVSKERDGMISPEVQRVAITDYCAARGYDLVDVVEGIDESGSRARSAWWPRLDQAVAAVESGDYDVIVVWKFSRTARHRLRWAVAIDRVDEAGGRLESATEQVDVTTSTGRFTRGMLAELNAFEAERIGEVWKEVHARRIATGRPASGKDRWGYTYDRVQKLHIPDPVTGPVLADMYRRYVAGESVYELVRWLNGHGFRTNAGGLWSDRSLRRVMDSGFAAGRFTHQGVEYVGVHDPLISGEVWQAYGDARHVRRARPARSERSAYPLSGMVLCGRCGHPMVAGQFGQAREPKYRCKAGKEQGPLGCRGGYVMQAYLLDVVAEGLQVVAGSVDAEAATSPRPRRLALEAERGVVARQIAANDKALTRLAVQHAQEPLPLQVYAQARSELVAVGESLAGSLESLERQGRRAPDDVASSARGLLADWEHLPVSARREALRSLFQCLVVLTGRPRARVWLLDDDGAPVVFRS